MFEPMELTNDAVIKVIGVGGGGGNAVEHMVRERIEGVEFFAVNTDAQALRKTAVGQTIQIGGGITKGLGAGANPEVGRNAAEEDREALRAALDGADMVFIAAGMGGGTGTGAAPVVAEVAKDLGILTVAVVTKPFNFEGKKRMAFAEQGITELSKHVDSLITIPNDKLLKVLGRGRGDGNGISGTACRWCKWLGQFWFSRSQCLSGIFSGACPYLGLGLPKILGLTIQKHFIV